MRGQLSVEMLVILVIILGISALVASVLLRSANKAAEKAEQKADYILNASEESYARAKKAGEFCSYDSECASGNCNPVSSRCS
ncbi:MAG: type II secretion system GspH family protein [Candidatus Micrarchaeota archaeon]|nr:type II secretion system GspH family protein [Candidatus Micrarchaeota archaeon]